MNTRVTLLSKLTAVSSEPVTPGKTHPLTVLDHAMGLHTLHIVFYYRTNPFGSFDLNPIRVTLSEALSMYPTVTGRFAPGKDGNWVLKCNDAGVRILRAKVGATLDQWLRSADGAEERDLTAWESMPEDPAMWSPFRIQISEFEEGGVAVGVSCLHMHADPTCVTLLINSWVQVHRRQPIAYPPFFNPSAIRGGRQRDRPSLPADHYYATKSTAQTPPSLKMASAVFSFSNSAIKQCLTELHGKCPDATPFDLLAALFWMRVARLKARKHDYEHSLSVCVDFRKRMDTPLPDGYFGNALHFSQLSISEKAMQCIELWEVVNMVQSHVSGLGEDDFQSGIDWLDLQKSEGGKFASPFRMYGPELTCVSMEHMIIPSTDESLMYAAAFDLDGKPAHVSYHVGNVEGEGLIVVMPSPEGGIARRVMVTLPEGEMEKLCEDEAILDLKPTMLLSGKV